MTKKSLLFSLAFAVTVSCFGQTKKTSGKSEFGQWAKTPAYGWNSWDCYGPTVVENEVKANADYMAKYLKKTGWEYVVVDIRWYVENDKAHGYNEKDAIYVMDEYGRLMPSPVRFPSAANGKGFKPLADYIHAKGLKFGIHIMRGIPMEAVKKNTPILGSKAKAQDVYSKDGLCPWLRDMYTVVAGKEGAQEYYNSIFKLYASWGLDFVKVDDLSVPYHQGEIEMIRGAIDHCGRKIVLSTSPGETPIENAEHVKTHANMWRIVGDFWDNWPQLKEHFEVCNRWAPHIGDGHFPDADMLPLGRIGIRAERGDNRMSAFSKDEQYTLMSLFSIFRSPLMFGGDLPSNDDFTLSLITNKEVLEVNKYSKNNRQLFRTNDLIAWAAEDTKSEDIFLAVFNAQDQKNVEEEKALWKSDLLSRQANKLSTEFDINIAGAKKLYLVVTDNGEDINHSANWIEPCLSGNGKDGLKLTDLEWSKSSTFHRKPVLNLSSAHKTLNIESKDYANGIGSYSNSVIIYDIPEGYTRFKAKVGLDAEGITDLRGSNAKFMVFTQDPRGEMPSETSKIAVSLDQLGIKGECAITNLWTKEVLGTFKGSFSPEIKRHASGLYRIHPKK